MTVTVQQLKIATVVIIAVSIHMVNFNDVFGREQSATILASALLYFKQRCKVVRFGRVFAQTCSPVKPVAIERRTIALHFDMTANRRIGMRPQARTTIAEAGVAFV